MGCRDVCIGCEKQRESIRNACGAFGDCVDIPGCSAWNEEIGTILCHCMASVRREFHGGGTLFLMSAKEKEAPSKEGSDGTVCKSEKCAEDLPYGRGGDPCGGRYGF